MTSDPYLILHKVRGEPAFDIAIKMQMEHEEEPWWIIPTSGHRAYPYFHQPLHEIVQEDLMHDTPLAPEDCPDHYSCNDRSTTVIVADSDVAKLLEKIGLAQPINRRA